MSESLETDFYVQGRDGKLDRKYSEYKKLCLWSGPAVGRALNDQEASSLIEVWNKDQRTPWRLTFQDVSTLVELSDRICLFRKNMKRERARLRKEKSRENMRNAAEKGDANARRKIKEIKKGDRDRAARYYNVKRKSKRENSIGAKRTRVKRKRRT